jgi:hypothetical protein
VILQQLLGNTVTLSIRKRFHELSGDTSGNSDYNSGNMEDKTEFEYLDLMR